MAAVPFKAVLKFVCEGTKRTFQHSCTVSDVNAAFYLFEDGNNVCTLPSNEGVVQLADVILGPATGTDTTTAAIYANQKNTGEVLMNASNAAANQARQFAGVPVRFAPGAQIRFIQQT